MMDLAHQISFAIDVVYLFQLHDFVFLHEFHLKMGRMFGSEEGGNAGIYQMQIYVSPICFTETSGK